MEKESLDNKPVNRKDDYWACHLIHHYRYFCVRNTVYGERLAVTQEERDKIDYLRHQSSSS